MFANNTDADHLYHVLAAGDPMHSRIASPEERGRAHEGDWVFTELGECESFALDPEMDADRGIFLGGAKNEEWLSYVTIGLMRFAPNVGFGIVMMDEVPTLGFVMPNEEEADYWLDSLRMSFIKWKTSEA